MLCYHQIEDDNVNKNDKGSEDEDHKKEGDEKLEIQYRVLGIYNNDFQVPNSPTRPG